MGTWKPLANQPNFNASTMLLLTDGTVMCQDGGVALGGSSHWHKLTPDANGSYLLGTWTALADSPSAPRAYASAVLINGSVFVAGGEYADGLEWDLLAAQVYNPVSDIWNVASVPPGWTNIGDAPSCMLPDGRLLVGSIIDNSTAIYDYTNNKWVAARPKVNINSNEETWTLLPDGTILSVDCNGHPGAEKYIISADQWVKIDPTPKDLVEAASIEIGPAMLLPDGRVFCIGATPHTALYQKGANPTDLGTWSPGPDFPPQPGNPNVGAKDAPACLLPNGNVLCIAGPVNGNENDYLCPMYYFEFDPTAGKFAQITTNPPSHDDQIPPSEARLLLLPTGDVMFSNGTMNISVYQPAGTPNPSWMPSIDEIKDRDGKPATDLTTNYWYNLFGRQLNGLSQAVSYGDDAQMATNYPLVRIKNNATGYVVYCPTQNHSTMGVATGSAQQNTWFLVPNGIEPGPSDLQVVANGIGSTVLPVTVK